MLSYVAIAILLFLSAAVLWFVFDLRKNIKLSHDDRQQSERLAAMQESMRHILEENRELRREIDKKLSETHHASRQQMNQTIRTVQGITGQSAKLIGDVTEKLAKLDETNRQVINFSAQLQNLQDILKNPKQRGVLGEYFLEETLKNVLPPNAYKMQYGFKDGVIVDAAIFLQNKIIPIDSKFSLENYERILNSRDNEEREKWEKMFKQDLKNRIDETSKYIRPEENTMDFAFMFIPSEAIYYDLLINKVGAAQINTRDLIEYAFRDKKVIIVSPTSFFAYLQTVLQGLRALKIEESAKQIRNNVEKLGKHVAAYDEYLKKIGGSLGTTVNHFNNAHKEFEKIDKDVARITEGERVIEPLVLEKPQELA
ncbi:MAG TPA: DNA recombination protein RmuC [Candidatus Moranbacteria bacterium]|jgi:DNA recombination protein RmuC|nr:DNA recombination protein RmuC [Candidatus Moranbacteria bacterium]HPX93952.1 DNA recombination protein RmuC [Candidatus Moranbacteria bacterium]HQB59321.1 DNA recombination protein RmuC [Candidatus Moranbacteria bacterium]